MEIYECEAREEKIIAKCLNADCDSFCRLRLFCNLSKKEKHEKESFVVVEGEENSLKLPRLPLSLHIVMGKEAK